ncbi:MAG: HAMP domain-containing sensor histidine kinase [Sandaracinaceae bacterium]|nr:HAMP domain-containing sensor histidine kinase [Sandaracinaceae bacterium]
MQAPEQAGNENPFELSDLIPPSLLEEIRGAFQKSLGITMSFCIGAPTKEQAQSDRENWPIPIEFEGRHLGVFRIHLPIKRLPLWNPSIPDTEIARVVESLLRPLLAMLLWMGYRSHLAAQVQLQSAELAHRTIENYKMRLEKSEGVIQSAERIKANLLATVSHELRTPLTAIIGYSDLLLSGLAGELLPEQAEYIETIRNKGEELLALIGAMIELSKSERGAIQLDRTQVDMRALLEEVVQTLSFQAEKKQIQVELDVEKDLPPFFGDPLRLRQVFRNLLENALKFTDEGGKVRLCAKTKEIPQEDVTGPGAAIFGLPRRALEISVTDTGIGIDPAHQERIFEPFFQVDASASRSQGGTGIGLALVKSLVEAHGGRIRVESQVGQGSTFFVSLPLDEEEREGSRLD